MKRPKQKQKELVKRRSWTSDDITSLVLAFVPVVLSFIFEIITFFAYVAIVFFQKTMDNEMLSPSETASDAAIRDFLSASSHTGLFYLIKYTLCLIILGWWYMNAFCNTTKKDYVAFNDKPVRKMFTPNNIILFAISGYALQVFISSLLCFAGILFPSTMQEYGNAIGDFTSDSISILMLIAVIIFSPIAEEIMFRGLSMRYAKRFMKPIYAILFQAVLFGIYHGNLVQGIYAFLIGILFGLIAEKTDSIIPSIILHSVINASAYLIPEAILSSITYITLSTIASIFLILLIARLLTKSFTKITA